MTKAQKHQLDALKALGALQYLVNVHIEDPALQLRFLTRLIDLTKFIV